MKNSDPKIIKQLLADLHHYSKDRRRTAVIKLGMVGGDDAIRALILTVNNNNEDLIVRGRAALMLGKLGDPRAVEPLIGALDAPGFQTPFYAAQALGKLGDPRAIKPLLMVIEASNNKVTDAALEALRKLGHSPAAESETSASATNGDVEG